MRMRSLLSDEVVIGWCWQASFISTPLDGSKDDSRTPIASAWRPNRAYSHTQPYDRRRQLCSLAPQRAKSCSIAGCCVHQGCVMRHCAGGTCDWKEVLQSQRSTRSRTTHTRGVRAARGMSIVFPPKNGSKGLPRRESTSKAEGGVPYHTQ